MKTLQLFAPITLKAAAGKPRRFKIAAYNGGSMRITGFDLPVVVDLQGLRANGVAIVLDHELTTDATVGQADTVRNDGKTLFLAGQVTGTSPRVRQVIEQADAGHNWQASIGCMVEAEEEIPAGQLVVVNGQQFRGPVIVARRSVLFETSVLPVGADGTTSVNLAAKAKALKGANMDFETWLKQEMGIDAANLTEAGLALMTEEYDRQQNTAGGETAGEPVAAGAMVNLRASRAEEHTRIGAIERMTIGRSEITAAAIRGGWSLDKTENAMLKASRTTATQNFSRHGGSGPAQEKVLTASMAMTLGVKPDLLAKSKDIGEQAVDAATSLAHRGATIHSLLRANMEAAGVTPPSSIVGDAYIRAGFEAARMLKASGMTTVSLPGILSNVADKILLNGFESFPSSWNSFCAVTSSPNFKAQKRYRLVTGNTFDELPAGGHLKHTSFKPEEEYSNQLKTFGCMIALDRQTIINDDLSAFSKLLSEMGRHGMMKLERSVYELLLTTITGAAFFTNGRGNLKTGGGSALSITALSAAVAAFDSMTDANGEPMMLKGDLILTGPTLSNTAKLLTRDTQVIAVGVGSSAATVPDGNPHAGQFTPVKTPWLENALLSGYTATGWGLFAPPQGEAGLMEVGFLNGQKTPTTEEGELDFSQLGIAMRAYFDFGIAMSDYRFGVWNAGA